MIGVSDSGASDGVGLLDAASDRVQLLDADPGFGAALTPQQRQLARRFAVAQVLHLGPGRHDPPELATSEIVGLLVLHGLMVNTIEVAGRRCGELIGPGAVVRPWEGFGRGAAIPYEVSWRVLKPVSFAVIDQRLSPVLARWPRLLEELIRRTVDRSDRLALMSAICSLQHVQTRLLVLLWHLADRFGRVTLEGTVVPVPLTHSDLAELTGSQRPSVSTGLARLARQRILTRRADRTWLLHGQPPEQLGDLRTSGLTSDLSGDGRHPVAA